MKLNLDKFGVMFVYKYICALYFTTTSNANIGHVFLSILKVMIIKIYFNYYNNSKVDDIFDCTLCLKFIISNEYKQNIVKTLMYILYRL